MPVFSSLLKAKRRKPMMGSPAANDAVRDKLASLGDDGAAARHVLHFAYPAAGHDLANRDSMIAALADRGFGVADAAVQRGLVLEHYRAVTVDDFDRLTAELSALFAGRGWDYDGWECAVVAPDADKT